jgi:hypothetical protein
MATPPRPIASKGISDKVKLFLLNPALTSHFEVFIKPPSPNGVIPKFFSDNGAPYNSNSAEQLRLMCSDATLPGSSLATHESNNDFHGVTERFAYRRLYDDRIDLTFYVDAKNHYTIRFFETWIKYVAGEEIAGGIQNPDYFYRFRYPDGPAGYRGDSTLYVTKFERDYNLPRQKKALIYQFIQPYPISIQSMPISYDTSSLLKCVVSMTYTRYIVDPNKGGVNNPKNEPDPSGQSTANGVARSPFDLTPERQAQLNSAFTQDFNLGNLSAGTLTNTNFNPPNLF